MITISCRFTFRQIRLLLFNLVYYELSKRIISVGDICVESGTRGSAPILHLFVHFSNAQLLLRVAKVDLNKKLE